MFEEVHLFLLRWRKVVQGFVWSLVVEEFDVF